MGNTPSKLHGTGNSIGVGQVYGVVPGSAGQAGGRVPSVFIAGVLASGFDANKVFVENGRGHGALIAQALTRAVSWGAPDPASRQGRR